jgi:1-pyrroline-5-carboxylate dehydrogenase
MTRTSQDVPTPVNEPVLAYAPRSMERIALDKALRRAGRSRLEIPLVIGGRAVMTGRLGECRVPHDHRKVLATFHQGGATEVGAAIAAARASRRGWAATPWRERAAIFLRAADLLAGPWRQTLNAATMLGQGKTIAEAEADAACELADFWRFNAFFMQEIHARHPLSTAAATNWMDYRPLEGFVFAASPFNFTAIGGNLPTAPAMMGNTVVWKPASTAVLSAHHVMRLLEAAGLPPGVINMVPGPGAAVGDPALASPDLAGVHFTGSTTVFDGIWRTIGEKIGRYRTYPRIVGETGGKGFVFAHPSADVDALAAALAHGAFGYQGQKCSAASRAYIPKSLWPSLKRRLLERTAAIKLGDVADPSTDIGAVIDRHAFESIRGFIDYANARQGVAQVVHGGKSDDTKGWFIEPTVIVASDPRFKTMEEEIFGPVLTVFVYADRDLKKTIALCDRTSPYALTGAIFANDRRAIEGLLAALRDAAGNIYINDKPTGAVVGQQPFGGARRSGTNDKAGSELSLIRWTSPRTIKAKLDPSLSH